MTEQRAMTNKTPEASAVEALAARPRKRKHPARDGSRVMGGANSQIGV